MSCVFVVVLVEIEGTVCGQSLDLSGPARRGFPTVTYHIPLDQPRKYFPLYRHCGCVCVCGGLAYFDRFDAVVKTNGRCRSATTVKMSSFLFYFHILSLMPQTDGVARGDGENGKETHKGVGATAAGHIGPCLSIANPFM